MRRIILHDQLYSIGGPKAVIDGIENSYLGEKYDIVRLKQPESCGFNPFKAARFIYKYRKLINNMHAHVIYICGLEYVGLLMTIAAKLSNVEKIILSVHGSHWATPDNTIRKKILMYIIEPLEIKMADSVITVCEAAQKIIKPLSKSPKNCGIIYNTFPNVEYNSIKGGNVRAELNIPQDKIVVSSIGRVVEDKGHPYIIEAIKTINDSSFVFVIVGDGDYLNEYRKNCQDEINRGRLFILGRRTDINSILKDSDIFLFPTYSENHSIALLEAVNMRCCALCTDVGGNPEIIKNGVSGILIPPKNTHAIVDALNKLKDSSLRKKYSESAYIECKQKFSVENTYGKLDKLFSE